MSWLNFSGIASALADAPAGATTAASHEGSIFSILPMLIIFVFIFYFFMIRPQNKRMRAQKELLESLQVGDEVIITGGIVGKIARFKDNFVILTTGKNSEIVIQKSAVSSILPKGTLNSLE